MNRGYDYNNSNDFVNMCCRGEIRPNNFIEIRNFSGDQITRRSFMDHARILCQNNDTNLLSLLTEIHNKINKDMLVRGNNVPIFKNKVIEVIDEWPYGISYEDIFEIPGENLFNYDDLLKCNAVVVGLDNDMLELEKKVAQESEDLYSDISHIQGKCVEVSKDIVVCMQNLDKLSEDYEPKFPKILMDLSTKQKPYYTFGVETPDNLSEMVYKKKFREIPDNVSDIFANAILIPNMISKETEYNKSMLQNLHKNVRNKQLILSNLLENIPETKQEYFIDSVQRLIRSMVETSDEEEEEGVEEEDEEDEEEEVEYSPELKLEDREEIEKTLQEIQKEDLEEPEKKLLEDSKKQEGGNYELSFF